MNIQAPTKETSFLATLRTEVLNRLELQMLLTIATIQADIRCQGTF